MEKNLSKKEKDKLYYLKNKDKIAERKKIKYFKNLEESREKVRLRQKKRYDEKKDEINEKRRNEYSLNEEYKSYVLSLNKKYRQKNKEVLKNKKTEYYLKRRNKDAKFKILCNLRHRLNMAVKNNIKYKTTLELLGCTTDFLKDYLEKQFKNGMTWDNYGVMWHIDHIKPCAYFDLSDINQQKQCFHYSNLQPLFAIDNILKSDKLL
jgi:hypothetical protein